MKSNAKFRNTKETDQTCTWHIEDSLSVIMVDKNIMEYFCKISRNVKNTSYHHNCFKASFKFKLNQVQVITCDLLLILV